MIFSAFADLARARRSIRRYDDRPVSAHLIREILTVAQWSPSAHNRQPWRFVVIETEQAKHDLAHQMGAQLRQDLENDHVPTDVIEQDVNRSYERITSAPVLICVCMSMIDMDTYSDRRRNENEKIMAIQSTAMAGQTLLLGVHAAGLSACWLCAPLFCPEIVRNVLDLPKDWQPQGLITIGYPAQTRERTRHPLDTQVLWR